MSDRTQSWSSQEAARRDDMKTVVATIDSQVDKYTGILPTNVSWADFRNAFLVAVQMNPRLLDADRQSLWISLQRAASDGLKPDGREGAMVIFGDDQEDEEGNKIASAAKGKKKVQWMPMIGGLIKLVRNTGTVASIRAKLIYKGERVIITDEDGEETYKHVREIDQNSEIDDSPANIIGAYAVIRYKDGSWEMEAMTRRQIERVRAVSKAKKGPWVPWYDEMAKKTVLRRLIKRLDKSADLRKLDEVVNRDETMATIEGIAVSEPQTAQIAQEHTIRQEFIKPPREAAKVAPAAAAPRSSGEEATWQADAGQSGVSHTNAVPQSAGEEKTHRVAPSDVLAGNSGQPSQTVTVVDAEIWACDEYGEPVDRPEPMSTKEFADWFASKLFLTPEPEALREHNADAIAEACKASPAANRIISDAIARHERRKTEPVAAPTPATEPEKPAVVSAKPKREAIKVPKTPKGAPHWGNYGPLAKAEIALLKDEADIEDWIAVNQPIYGGKASEIAIGNWIRDRRKFLAGDPVPSAAVIHTSHTGQTYSTDGFVKMVQEQMARSGMKADITAWASGTEVQATMSALRKEYPETFARVIEIIDTRMEECP